MRQLCMQPDIRSIPRASESFGDCSGHEADPLDVPEATAAPLPLIGHLHCVENVFDGDSCLSPVRWSDGSATREEPLIDLSSTQRLELGQQVPEDAKGCATAPNEGHGGRTKEINITTSGSPTLLRIGRCNRSHLEEASCSSPL
jgi:hypothetical protein